MKEDYECMGKNAANHVALTPLSFLKRTAALYPNRPAIIHGQRRYSWLEVQKRVFRLANALRDHGIKDGDTVSVMLPNTPEMVEAHHAIPMTGAVVNAINVRLEAETIAYILNHGDAVAIIADTVFASVIKEAIAISGRDIMVINVNDSEGPGGELIGDIEYEAFITAASNDFSFTLPDDEWKALALSYTSGTSGRPKGVVYHHRGSYLMTMGTAAGWEVPLHPVYLYLVPMFHCTGWGHVWVMTMQAATIVCSRQVTPDFVFDMINTHGVTHSGGAPIVLSMLADWDGAEAAKPDHEVKLMTAGAPPPPSVLEKTTKLGFKVMQVYGLTETYGHVTMCAWQDAWDALSFEEQARLQSWQGVSFPMNEDAIVLDRESFEAVPQDGETQGEIAIRGNTVMKGYLKDEDATDAAMQNGWFLTGDVAVWHESGYIQIRDRLKDVIISGGENISSVEVEAVLHRHDDVALAAVVAMPDEKWGEVPCAFIETRGGLEPSAEKLDAFCRENLTGFKRPKHYVFGELPKTATGKIQKFRLRETARSLGHEPS